MSRMGRPVISTPIGNPVGVSKPAGTQAEYAPTKRVDRELTTNEWQTIMDKAWAVGIPHLTFTGGEPTLRDDLPALIAHAEKLVVSD